MTRSNPIQFSATQRVTLPFRARWAYIDNPTGNTVLVREGNTDQPTNLAEADWWVPALGARVMPCNASEFGLGVGAPFSTAPGGLPTVALAIFGDDSEPVPSIGSEAALSVTSLQAQERVLFSNPNGESIGGHFRIVPLPSDIRTVYAVNFGATGDGLNGINSFDITGVQSGLSYGSFVPINDVLGGVLVRKFRVNSSMDSELEIDYNVIGALLDSSWTLIGSSTIEPAAYDSGGESLVSSRDGKLASVGATTDPDTALTVIGRLKQLVTRLPAALINGALGVSAVLPPAEQPLTLTARTASVGFLVRDARGARGILAILRVTIASGTGGLTLQLRALDALSNVYGICADPAAVIAAGTTIYLLYPFTPPALAGLLVQQVQQPLPERFAVRVNHGDASSYTYALDFLYLS